MYVHVYRYRIKLSEYVNYVKDFANFVIQDMYFSVYKGHKLQ